MPEVISDTSPIQYLHQAGYLHLLAELYGSLTVPQGVVQEVEEGRKLGVDLPDLEALPWIAVRQVSSRKRSFLRLVPDLGRGEREVLALASGSSEALVLLDDGLARRHARLLEIGCTGTLGVLLRAKREGLLDVIAPIVWQLEQLGFRLDSGTRAAVLRLAKEEAR